MGFPPQNPTGSEGNSGPDPAGGGGKPPRKGPNIKYTGGSKEEDGSESWEGVDKAKEKKRVSRQKYTKSDKGKETQRRYRKSEAGKQVTANSWANRVAIESTEEKTKRLENHNNYLADIRANETSEERRDRLKKRKNYDDRKRANESPEEKIERLNKKKNSDAKRIANENPEEKIERLKKK